MTLASRGRAVTLVALLLLVGVYIRALAFTPLERFQGAAQKIFYLHVPAAWSAMLAMGMVGLASVLYLLLKDARFDRFAAASAEVGTAFCVVMLTTGPLWRSEEHTSELQSHVNLVCRLLLEKKNAVQRR